MYEGKDRGETDEGSNLAPLGRLPVQADDLQAVSRHRKKTVSYRRLRIGENDLWRLATIVQLVADKHGGTVSVTIVSADEEDTVTATEPGVFLRNDIPTQVKSVRIGFGRGFWEPIKIDVCLAVPARNDALIEVEGTDTSEVISVFYELDRELRLRRTGGGWLYAIDSHPWMWLLGVLGVVSISTALAYWCATAIVHLLGGSPQDEALRIPFLMLWLFGALTYTALVLWLFGTLRRAYPQVEFSGRLSDAGAGGRAWLFLVATLLLIPFLVNIAAALVTNVAKPSSP